MTVGFSGPIITSMDATTVTVSVEWRRYHPESDAFDPPIELRAEVTATDTVYHIVPLELAVWQDAGLLERYNVADRIGAEEQLIDAACAKAGWTL